MVKNNLNTSAERRFIDRDSVLKYDAAKPHFRPLVQDILFRACLCGTLLTKMFI